MSRMKKIPLPALSNIKLRTKLVWIVWGTLLAVFLSTFLTARLPYAAYDSQLYLRSAQMITLFSEQLQTETERLGDLTYRMLGDSILQRNLSIIKRAEPEGVEWVAARREVRQRMENFMLFSDDIVTLQLYLPDNSNLINARRGQPLPTEALNDIRALALTRGGREILLADGIGENTLVCARDVREVQDLTLDSLGILVLRIDLSRIVDRCAASLKDMGMPLSLSIYDGDARIYASADMQSYRHLLKDGYERIQVDGQEMLAVSVDSDVTGWQFVTAVPYGGIAKAIQHSTRLALLLSLGAMIAASLLGYWLIASILRHFQVLLQKFAAFSQGRIPQEEAPDDPYRDRKDEIGSLHRQFDEMARAYHRMIEDNFAKQRLLQEAQLHQLRAQIRPHFLFNTLESIYCLAKTASDERIATMTDALGKMLRASLKDQRDLITLEEDLPMAKEYLRIQLLRYGDRLQADFSIPDALLNTRIPSMTIQPLVENAVIHAAEEMLEQCRIRVYAYVEGDHVFVVIENNGPAVDGCLLEKLESGEIQPRGMGIGLRNIHRRIQLTFSDAYGLRVQSEKGLTRMLVDLPNMAGDLAHSKEE
nr:sensor histidine kinase [Clostridia bacterium]